MRPSEDFLEMARRHSMAILENTVTMDESAILFHTPKTKQQSRRWLPKSQPGPEGQGPHDQDQAHGSCLLQQQGPDKYQLQAQGDHDECIYIMEALGMFRKIFWKKRREMVV